MFVQVVGYGLNGEPMYMDTLHAPFPAIRFKEETSEIAKIREKETGDWKKMTVEEKKALYRHSFCQVCSISQFSFSNKPVSNVSAMQ